VSRCPASAGRHEQEPRRCPSSACVQLARGDAISLDAVLLGKEGAHVANEGARDLGRQFERFARHGPKIGISAGYFESEEAASQPAYRSGEALGYWKRDLRKRR